MISLFKRLPRVEHEAAAKARETAERLAQVMADDRTITGLRQRIGDRRCVDQPVRIERRRARR